MKTFIFGALLVQILHAQDISVPVDIAGANVTLVVPAANSTALANITAELPIATAAAAIPTVDPTIPLVDNTTLPVGPADIVLNPTSSLDPGYGLSTQSPTPTPTPAPTFDYGSLLSIIATIFPSNTSSTDLPTSTTSAAPLVTSSAASTSSSVFSDTGVYDGENTSTACPASCYDTDNGAYGARRALRARQTGGFAAFNFPDATNDCPASCYSSTTSSSMTSSSMTSSSIPPPSSPTSTSDTTLVTVASPQPASATTPDAADWTGNTVANICPRACDPANASLNACDASSTCTATGGGQNYCACPAGFRASAWNEADFSKQFRAPGGTEVFVASGVVCDQPCDTASCAEVLERAGCV